MCSNIFYCCSYLFTQSCLIHCNPMDCSLPCSSVHGDLPSKNNEAGCHFLFQGYSQPRDRTHVSCLAGGFFFFFFFYKWTTLETPEYTFKKTCRTASGGKYLRPLLSPSPEFNSFHFYLSVGLRIERESWNLSLLLQRERRKDKRVKGKEIFYKKQLE